MNDVEQPFRVFSAADVRAALPMEQAVAAMKVAFQELSAGAVAVPMRTHIELPRHRADVLVMSCYSPELDRVGVKLIALHPENVRRGLPFIRAFVLLVDAETGTPLAVMDGAALTALRTGGASGAATDALARPDAARVAIFGAGIQAATQLEGVCAVRDIRLAAVYDPDHARARAFADRMARALRIETFAAATPAAALADADIVCTATTSGRAVFDDADLAPGAHINAIGAYKPHEREIPAATVARARVVVDKVEAAWEEAGDLILARQEGAIAASHIHAELGEVLAGKKPGRESAEQITLFKSVGIANQDLSAAQEVLARATALGLGATAAL